MLYGDRLIAGTRKTLGWMSNLPHHIQEFFDNNSLEDIDKSLKEFTKVMNTARQVFGDAPFGNPEKNLKLRIQLLMMPYMIHQAIKKYNRKTLESNATMVREVVCRVLC